MLTFIIFPSILVFCTDQRKSALGGNEEKKDEFFFDDNQHIRENAEMLTSPLKKNKNLIYQGMYENHKSC